MEAPVANTADTVVVTTPRMQEAFRNRYSRIPPDRVVWITNSIDSAMFQPARRETGGAALTIYFERLITDRGFRNMKNDLGAFSRFEFRQLTATLVARMGAATTVRGADVGVTT
jgi:hypothetical protein